VIEQATWYLGPLGDLRPLVVPNPGVKIDEVRYGGVHQGLSGARTMDITGHRREYEFTVGYLDQDEFRWFEALHTRLVPGPFRLIDPFRKNRLSVQASRLLPVESRNNGVYLSAAHTLSRDWPADVAIVGRSLGLSGWSGDNAFVQFDQQRPAPIVGDEVLTASVYLRADAAYPVILRMAWYDQDRVWISNTDVTVQVDTEWTRYWHAFGEAPDGAAAATFTLVLGTASTQVYVAAPQVEADAAFPTSWELGGGAPVVLLDQLPSTSLRFPLRDIELSLLEA
jgi:hypothetical protein